MKKKKKIGKVILAELLSC